MARYITKLYDRLDRIVYDYYGDTLNGIVEYVLEKNPGLERQPILLPRNLTIELPARPDSTSPTVPSIRQIRLWDV